MNKYKIGDKVKINQWFFKGKTGIIKEIQEENVSMYKVWFDKPYTKIVTDKYTWCDEISLSPLKKTIRDVKVGDIVVDDKIEETIIDVGKNGFVYEVTKAYPMLPVLKLFNYTTFDQAEKDGWEITEEEETKYDPCSECLKTRI